MESVGEKQTLWENSERVIPGSPSLLLLSDADRTSVRMWGGCRTERGVDGGRTGGPQERTRIWMGKHQHLVYTDPILAPQSSDMCSIQFQNLQFFW